MKKIDNESRKLDHIDEQIFEIDDSLKKLSCECLNHIMKKDI